MCQEWFEAEHLLDEVEPVVVLAEHALLKRPCALKVIRPDLAGDPRSLERFEREVSATASLSDPHIVEIYDYGRTDDGTFFYVMEQLHGLSLGDLVGRHRPLPAGLHRRQRGHDSPRYGGERWL